MSLPFRSAIIAEVRRLIKLKCHNIRDFLFAMRFHVVTLFLFALFRSTHAIYADEAYQVDYHQALLGIPQSHTTLFHRPQSSSNASLLYTVSDKAILGVVNPRDGALLWRQPLAGSPADNGTNARLVVSRGTGNVVAVFGHTVTAWDALDGRLVWNTEFPSHLTVLDMHQAPGTASPADSEAQDVFLLLGNAEDISQPATIVRLARDSGLKMWEYNDIRHVFVFG